jgi:N-hydroxyarylamine O-acetyltransferase
LAPGVTNPHCAANMPLPESAARDIMANDVNLTAYFERIGFAGSIAPTVQTLDILHGLHPLAIPFEALNPLLGLPVLLDQKSLEQKLLADRRGGYCFEQNLMFLRVLRELGFSAKGLGARVLWNHPEGTIRPRGHMLILVDVAGSHHIADVGFGGMTMTASLKLRADVEQPTTLEPFRLLGGGEALWRLEVKIGEEWKPVYAFDLVEHHDIDYEAPNHFAATHPETIFRRGLIVAQPGKGKRLALAGNRLTTHVIGGEPERRVLTSVAEIKEVLSGTFGIGLPPAELLDPALDRVLAEANAQA